jgi:DNA repair protein RadC
MINIQKYNLQVIKESGGRYDLSRTIRSAAAARDVFTEVLNLDKRAEEVFAMITLDVKSKITGVFEVSVGSLSGALVTPREVFKRALLTKSKAVIFAHNHPSGEPQPSADDISITKKLVKSGKILNIDVFDHLILGNSNDNYISLKSEGHID